MGLFGRIDGAEIFARSYDIAFLDNFEDVRGPPRAKHPKFRHAAQSESSLERE